MVVVKATSLSSLEIDGQPGVRLELSSVGTPVIEEAEQFQDEQIYAKQLTKNVLSGLQQAGLFPKVSQPRVVLFLTMKEYEALGRPQINDLIELSFESSKIILKTLGKVAT
jgi:hypothetical protein